MPELKVKIQDRVAIYNGSGIVAENEDYELSFDFDEDWSSLPLYARYIWNKYHWDEPIKDNKASIPYVKNGTQLLVGVIAGDKISTTATEIPVATSVVRDSTIGHPRRPADPNATKAYVDEKVAELKIYTDDEIAALETQISEQTTALEKYVIEQIENIPVDQIPTEGSLKPISSDGVYKTLKDIKVEGSSAAVPSTIMQRDANGEAEVETIPFTYKIDGQWPEGAEKELEAIAKKVTNIGAVADVVGQVRDQIESRYSDALGVIDGQELGFNNSTKEIYLYHGDWGHDYDDNFAAVELPVDKAPIEDSEKFITSGGVYDAIKKVDDRLPDTSTIPTPQGGEGPYLYGVYVDDNSAPYTVYEPVIFNIYGYTEGTNAESIQIAAYDGSGYLRTSDFTIDTDHVGEHPEFAASLNSVAEAIVAERTNTQKYVDDALAALKTAIETEILGGSW